MSFFLHVESQLNVLTDFSRLLFGIVGENRFVASRDNGVIAAAGTNVDNDAFVGADHVAVLGIRQIASLLGRHLRGQNKEDKEQESHVDHRRYIHFVVHRRTFRHRYRRSHFLVVRRIVEGDGCVLVSRIGHGRLIGVERSNDQDGYDYLAFDER